MSEDNPFEGFPVGSGFTFLNVHMVVLEHTILKGYEHMVCIYVDIDWKVRQMSFRPEHMPALRMNAIPDMPPAVAGFKP